MDVVAYQGGDHVRDVVPVIAEACQPLNRLPCLGWVVSQQLIRDDLVHRDVQPRAERLAVGSHLLIALKRIFEFCVLRLEQEGEFVLVVRIQQFEVESLVGAVPCGYRPRSPTGTVRVAEPAFPGLPGPAAQPCDGSSCP